MANNKYAGYTPDPSKEKKVEGTTEINNRLNKFNPYEFRKGMDYELTSIGCNRLAESTEDERLKATETVLKNLEENNGYYTSLITYETKFRNVVKGDKKPTFKAWLEEQGENRMQEVDKEYKNDKMIDVKPNDFNTIKMKTIQPLKEAIKKEIEKILEVSGKEADKINKEDAKKEKSDEKSAVNDAKSKRKELEQIDKAEAKDKKEKKDLQSQFKPAMVQYNDDGNKDKYEKAVGSIPKKIKDINKRLKGYEKRREEISLAEKTDKRAVAKIAMDKDVHMEILNIIKEAGVSLREGADGVRMYYEIAKTAYMEGLTAGLKN